MLRFSRRLLSNKAPPSSKSPLAAFRDAFSKTWNEGWAKDKQLEKDVEDMNKAFKPAVETLEKTGEKLSGAAEKVFQGAEKVASVSAKVVSPITSGVKSGAKFVAETQAAQSVASAAKVISSTPAVQAIAKEVHKSAQAVLQDTHFERTVGRLDTDEIHNRKRVVLNTTATELMEKRPSPWEDKMAKLGSALASSPVVNVFRKAKSAIGESDNFLAGAARGIGSVATRVTTIVGGTGSAIKNTLMPETPNGKAIAVIRMYDPQFSESEITRYARDYMVPRVQKAIIERDLKGLEELCTPKLIALLNAIYAQYDALGIKDVSRTLDVRQFEYLSAMVTSSAEGENLEGYDEGQPLVMLRFTYDEVHHLVDNKGKTFQGSPTNIRYVTAVWVLKLDLNSPTVKWQVDEFAISGVDGLI